MVNEVELNLFDIVATKDDINELGIKKGLVGTIIYVYSSNLFEVEFISEDGATFIKATIEKHYLKKITPNEKKFIRKVTLFFYG